MRKPTFISILSLAFTSTLILCPQSQAENEFELSAAYAHILPKNQVLWGDARGLEFQLTFTDIAALNLDERVGISFIVGHQVWDAQAQPNISTIVDEDAEFAVTYRDAWTGDATLTQLGISINYHEEIYPRLKGRLAVGARYVIVDENIDHVGIAALDDVNGQSESLLREIDVDIGNSILGVISAQVDINLFQRLDAFVRGSWQFDATKGDRNDLIGIDDINNNLQGFVIQAGLNW